jgi:KilA-N domain
MKIVMHKANGLQIGQRREDGYINLTQMAQASHKDLHDYFRLNSTQAFMKELSLEPGISGSKIVQVLRGRGDRVERGTWGHPYVAIHCGQWCSPNFAVLVSKWVVNWMVAAPNPVSPQHVDWQLELDELEQLMVSVRSQARTLHTGAHQPVDDILLKSLHTLSHNQLSVVAKAISRIQALKQAAIEDSSSGIKIAAHPAEPVDPIAEVSTLAAEVETRETSKPIEPFPVSSREPSVRWTVDLSESLHRKLSLRAARSGRSKADIVRMLLEEALQDVDD